MKAAINIAKRQGSSGCTRNGAMLTAMRAPTVRSLTSPQWALEGDGSTVDAMRAAKELRERLELVCSELTERQHASFADLESSGLFGSFCVLERRGFWRVETTLE